jgi:hypothetical protein
MALGIAGALKGDGDSEAPAPPRSVTGCSVGRTEFRLGFGVDRDIVRG